MYCDYCGSYIDDNYTICPYCGASMGCVDPQYQQQYYQQYQQPYMHPYQGYNNWKPKYRLIAVLLGVFLGGVGMHNFYLGKKRRAILQIVLTVCTCGIGGLLGLLEGILIFLHIINTDGYGNRLQ